MKPQASETISLDMTPECKARLVQRYPLILSEDTEILCANGWASIIDALCESLQARTAHGAPQVRAWYIKEKYGELRFAGVDANAEQQGMIAMARAMSAHTCELCGQPGETRARGSWILTRCPAHMPSEALSLDAFERVNALNPANDFSEK